MYSEHKITIFLKRTTFEKYFSVFLLCISFFLLLKVLYYFVFRIDLSGSNFIGIVYGAISFLGILLGVLGLVMPNKIILSHGYLMLYSSTFIFRKYSVGKIRSIELADKENFTIAERLINQYYSSDNAISINTDKKLYYLNLQNIDDFKILKKQLENVKNENRGAVL